MKWAYGIWSATCTVPVAIYFFAEPAWDTSSGGQVYFGIVLIVMAIVWLIGWAHPRRHGAHLRVEMRQT
jgi:hypothetical protein